MHRVLISPSSYHDCREAVDRAFEMFSPDLAGKNVLVKPNVLRAAQPEEAITTHPSILQAVVERVEKEGPAGLVVGDNPGVFSYGANEKSFATSGLMEAAGKYYLNIGAEAVETPFNGKFAQFVSVSPAVLQADVIISLPKFKTHGLTTLTGAIKNSYGILPGAQKAKLHAVAGDPWRFAELVVDVFGLRAPDFFIMDAIVGMEGNGPASKELRHIGKIIASDNAVAMDATVATMMGVEPGDLRFLQVAKERGFGDYDNQAIVITGDLEKIPDFKLPPMAVKVDDISPAIRELLHGRTLLRPSVDEKRCTLCGTCVEQCPVSALVMGDDIPRVDKEKCITCFCCQEMCPEAAITLS